MKFPNAIITLAMTCLISQTLPAAYTPPFQTLEAESPAHTTNGKIIRMEGLPERTTMTPALEASGRAFVELSGKGQSLTIPEPPAADTLVLRHCIPDAPGGNGTNATLSLHVNGKFRQKLTLSSYRNWLYGEPGHNGQSNDPTKGSPHVFWDETPFYIDGGVKAGDTFSLSIDEGDTAAYYRIDSLDLETATAPLTAPEGSLSVTDFGADGSDEKDDSAAILACIAAAKEKNLEVWLPPRHLPPERQIHSRWRPPARRRHVAYPPHRHYGRKRIRFRRALRIHPPGQRSLRPGSLHGALPHHLPPHERR